MAVYRRKSEAKILAEAIRKLRRTEHKETLFWIPGETPVGDFRRILSPYDAGVAKFIRSKYPTAKIANENWEVAATEQVGRRNFGDA